MKRKLFFKIFFLASFLGAFSSYAGDNGRGGNQLFKLPANVSDSDYLANKIVLKVKPEFRDQLTENGINVSAVKDAFTELGISSMERMFPHATPIESEYNSWGAKQADITIIYDLQYTAKVSLETAINRLIATNAFQYVEPWYVQHIMYWPNDPLNTNGGQYFLKKIKADSAWDVVKGDTNVVIGIVDSGTDPLHSDLAGNLKHNYADPIDGIDNDGDGYVDNFSGWDISDNDNNTTVGNQNHGSAVSGDACAINDNGVGVSSPSFNCKFLPVKSAKNTSGTSIDNGYQGVVYAADHGCQIINCSWGGPGGGQAAQDVITYATINKNALMVCSAGNNNDNVIQYPAGLNYVLNVAATTTTDTKASFSTYGTWVTISAPGNGIYSTVYNNSYTSMSGTSMASPITAGAAALVRSKFKNYNALQLAAQLRATADNINGVNAAYIGQLGSGRVNLYRAVTSTTTKSADMINFKATDNNDNAFVVGDTVRISGDVINYLAATTNLNVTISTTSGTYVTLLAPLTFNAGAITTMGTKSNSATPFQAVIKAGTPLNTLVSFKFTLTDGAYSSTASYSFLVNVDYLNITVNDISTIVTSKGNMAWNDADLTTRAQGLGFIYRDSSCAFEIGFMAGTDASHVSDNVRVGGTTQAYDAHFASVSNVTLVQPSPVGADFESTGIFNDSKNPTPLNILVHQRTFAWSDAGDRKYVIVQYIIKNTGASALSNFFGGIYADWDIGAGGVPDNASVDKVLKLGYVWHNVPTGFYAGTKLLTKGGFNNYAIDNDSICPGVNLYVSWNTAEKYTTLSTPRDNAGGCGANDVGNVVSSGPFTINAGDSVTIAFALLAGDDLADLKTSAGNAQVKYDGPLGIKELQQIGTTFSLQSVDPNPSSGTTTFHFTLASAATTGLTLYDVTGQKVRTLISEKMSAGTYQYSTDLSNLEAGIYFYRLQSGDKSATGKLTIVH